MRISKRAKKLAESDCQTMIFMSENDRFYKALAPVLEKRAYDVHCICTNGNYACSDYYSPPANVSVRRDVEILASMLSSAPDELSLMTALMEFAACDFGTLMEAAELADMLADGKYPLVEERFGHGYMLDDAHREMALVKDLSDIEKTARICARKLKKTSPGLIELSSGRDDTEMASVGDRKMAYFIISDDITGKMAARQIMRNGECAAVGTRFFRDVVSEAPIQFLEDSIYAAGEKIPYEKGSH